MSLSYLHLTCMLALLFTSCVPNINPGWKCIRATAPIRLYQSSDVVTQIGTLEAKERAEIIDTVVLKFPAPAAGAVTHFRVRTHAGLEGWLLWEGNTFVGSSRRKCWEPSR